MGQEIVFATAVIDCLKELSLMPVFNTKVVNERTDTKRQKRVLKVLNKLYAQCFNLACGSFNQNGRLFKRHSLLAIRARRCATP